MGRSQLCGWFHIPGRGLRGHVTEFLGGVFFAELGSHAAEFDEVDRLAKFTEAFANVKRAALG